MIVDLLTIRNKRVIAKNDGSKLLELGESVINYKYELVPIYTITVTESQAGKPWLIAKKAYGTNDVFDLLLFFNGYSNPYSINVGDEIVIFEENSMRKNVRDLTNKREEKTDKQKRENSKLPAVDSARQKLKARLNQREAETATAPNVNDGVPQQEVADGVITLGTDVSESRCKNQLSETQSRSELIRKLVLDKIQNGT